MVARRVPQTQGMNQFLVQLNTDVRSSWQSSGNSGGPVKVTHLVKASGSREPEKSSVEFLAEDITLKYSKEEIEKLISLLRSFQPV